MSKSRKVVMIGLDGASFQVIKQLETSLELPNFQRLMEKGVWGEMKSTIPPVTATAWPSMFTGVNPGKHGLFDFTDFTHKGYGPKLQNASNVMSKPFWEILGEYGKRSIVVNIPMTFPPRPFNGVMVGGMLSSREAEFTYPTSIRKELLEEFPDYQFFSDLTGLANRSKTTEERRAYLEEVKKNDERMFQVARWLMGKGPWDLLFLGVMGLDRVGHFFWEFRSEKNFFHKSLGKALEEIYSSMDEVLGNFLELLPEDYDVVLVSDHGWGDVDHDLYLNHWLAEQGHLALQKPGGEARAEGARAPLPATGPAPKKKKTLRVPDFVRALFRLLPFKEQLHARFLGNYQLPGPDRLLVDHPSSKCWVSSSANQGLVFNVKEEKEAGFLEMDEARTLGEEIKAGLEAFICPHCQANIIRKVHFRDSLYHGPFTGNSPLLVVEPKNYNTRVYPEVEEGGKIVNCRKKEFGGWHKVPGIFLGFGPSFIGGPEIQDMSILDAIPTVLAVLGVPIPRGMDGKPVSQARLAKEGAISYSDLELSREAGTGELDEEQEQHLKEHLGALGYL